jgi:PAS domain S-box-containing protein
MTHQRNETLLIKSNEIFKLFNQNPASMAIRISDNMMLNANNSLELFGYSFKEEVIGKTELKLFTEQEKYRVDIYQQANEVIKDFEVNVQNKKEIRFDINILLKLEIDNEPCLLIVA